MTNKVSRRTIAKGAAWTAPALALSSAAVASAASSPVDAVIGKLHFGSATINNVTHSIYLCAETTTSFKAGTTVSWQICLAGSGVVPNTSYNGWGGGGSSWTFTTSPAAGTPITNGCFTVTLNVLSDVNQTQLCPYVYWSSNLYPLTNNTQISVTPTVTGAPQGEANNLVYNVGKRHPSSVNKPGRVPFKYISKSGGCWPEVNFTRLLPGNGYDNAVEYPAGTNVPTPNGQWNGYYVQAGGNHSTYPVRDPGPYSTQFLHNEIC